MDTTEKVCGETQPIEFVETTDPQHLFDYVPSSEHVQLRYQGTDLLAQLDFKCIENLKRRRGTLWNGLFFWLEIFRALNYKETPMSCGSTTSVKYGIRGNMVGRFCPFVVYVENCKNC